MKSAPANFRKNLPDNNAAASTGNLLIPLDLKFKRKKICP